MAAQNEWAETHASDPPSTTFSGGILSENALLFYVANGAYLLLPIPHLRLA